MPPETNEGACRAWLGWASLFRVVLSQAGQAQAPEQRPQEGQSPAGHYRDRLRRWGGGRGQADKIPGGHGVDGRQGAAGQIQTVKGVLVRTAGGVVGFGVGDPIDDG